MSSPTKEQLPKVSAAIKNELTSFDSSKMKHAETNEKNPLPSKEDVQQEKQHNSILQGVENFEKGKLNPTETQEKVCLPKPEDVASEKVQQNILEGVRHFKRNSLRRTSTEEKVLLPNQTGNRNRRVLIRRGTRSMSKDEPSPTPTPESGRGPFSYANLKSVSDRKVAPQSPASRKSDLGELLDSIKTYSKNNLRKVKTVEKNSLPTKQDIEEEKEIKRGQPPPLPPMLPTNRPDVHQDMKSGVENFNKRQLKRTKTREKLFLPDAQDVQKEKNMQELLNGIQSFSKVKLRPTRTVEKNVLPTKDDIAEERSSKVFVAPLGASVPLPPLPPPPPPPAPALQRQQHKDALVPQEREHLRSKSPCRLKILPPVEVKGRDLLSQFLAGIQSFSKNHLRPTKTKEKNVLPSQEDIDIERQGGRGPSFEQIPFPVVPAASPSLEKREIDDLIAQPLSPEENPPQKDFLPCASPDVLEDSSPILSAVVEEPSLALPQPVKRIAEPETAPPLKISSTSRVRELQSPVPEVSSPSQPVKLKQAWPPLPPVSQAAVQPKHTPARNASPPRRSPRRDESKKDIPRLASAGLIDTNPEEDAMLEEELKNLLVGKDIDQLIQEFLEGETKPKSSNQMLERIKSCTQLANKDDYDDDDDEEETSSEEEEESEDDETPVGSPQPIPWSAARFQPQTPTATQQQKSPWSANCGSASPLTTPGPRSQVRLIPVMVPQSESSSSEEEESEEEEEVVPPKKVVTAVNVQLQRPAENGLSSRPGTVTAAGVDPARRRIVYRGYKPPN